MFNSAKDFIEYIFEAVSRDEDIATSSDQIKIAAKKTIHKTDVVIWLSKQERELKEGLFEDIKEEIFNSIPYIINKMVIDKLKIPEEINKDDLIINETLKNLPLVQYVYYRLKEDLLETESNTVEEKMLPDELNTERARKYFKRAVEAGYMTMTAQGAKWKNLKAVLGYFVERIFCPTNTEKLPEKAINNFFGIDRIGSAITALHNGKKEQKWRAEIDKLFID